MIWKTQHSENCKRGSPSFESYNNSLPIDLCVAIPVKISEGFFFFWIEWKAQQLRQR